VLGWQNIFLVTAPASLVSGVDGSLQYHFHSSKDQPSPQSSNTLLLLHQLRSLAEQLSEGTWQAACGTPTAHGTPREQPSSCVIVSGDCMEGPVEGAGHHLSHYRNWLPWSDLRRRALFMNVNQLEPRYFTPKHEKIGSC
jgi:hypothetical protein